MQTMQGMHMFFFYTLFIRIYTLMIRLAALFSPKARLWVKGRRGWLRQLEGELRKANPEDCRPRIWFHCASLGEFEQGRPVIEAWRERHPDHLIVLTFFSPSGYEVRKNYPGVDLVAYLPSDTPRNARAWLDLLRPEKVLFVKYEYWFNYLHQLAVRQIPVYIVSAIFRPEQHFFRWYGGWFLRQLQQITHFFVQDETSAGLLGGAGIRQFSLTGDTRFDRVFKIAMENKPVPLLEEFAMGSRVVIAGSSWPSDEKLLKAMIRQNSQSVKYVIAPHETDAERIRLLKESLPGSVLCYSEATSGNIRSAKVLVIDSIGLLSRLYRYGSFALIGGGFGAGIHNILEAAAFGVPVVFGPAYGKFAEANELIARQGAFPVTREEEFLTISNKLLEDRGFREAAALACSQYVAENQGATRRIIGYIFS